MSLTRAARRPLASSGQPAALNPGSCHLPRNSPIFGLVRVSPAGDAAGRKNQVGLPAGVGPPWDMSPPISLAQGLDLRVVHCRYERLIYHLKRHQRGQFPQKARREPARSHPDGTRHATLNIQRSSRR